MKDQPNTMPGLIHRLRDDLRRYALRELAVTHLTEAITHVRHHVKPTAKICTKLAELHPEWRSWVNNGNEEKFDPWTLHVTGNNMENDDHITISIRYVPTWEKVFEELRKYDFTHAKETILADLKILDKLVELESEAFHAVQAVRLKIPEGKHYYAVESSFPILFRDKTERILQPGSFSASINELKRIGIESERNESEYITTKDGVTWQRDGRMWSDYKPVARRVQVPDSLSED